MYEDAKVVLSKKILTSKFETRIETLNSSFEIRKKRIERKIEKIEERREL
jgi:hypothetical protein